MSFHPSAWASLASLRLAQAAAALALVAGSATLAQAAEFTRLVPAQSRIGFAYQQMGVGMTGEFKRFEAQLRFDPAQPAKASATVTIPLAAIDLGNADADAEIATPTWLNIAAFPSARFVLGGVKPEGGERYTLSGTLTIKGQSRPLSFPATFTVRDAQGVLDGRFTIRRGDFRIGEGAWRSFDVVANDITVTVRLTVAR